MRRKALLKDGPSVTYLWLIRRSSGLMYARSASVNVVGGRFLVAAVCRGQLSARVSGLGTSVALFRALALEH